MFTSRLVKTFRSNKNITRLASWDTKELEIPKDEKPIITIPNGTKYLGVLGFHNQITSEGDIQGNFKSNND